MAGVKKPRPLKTIPDIFKRMVLNVFITQAIKIFETVFYYLTAVFYKLTAWRAAVVMATSIVAVAVAVAVAVMATSIMRWAFFFFVAIRTG